MMYSRKLNQPFFVHYSQVPHEALRRFDDFMVDDPSGGWLPSEHDGRGVHVQNL